MTADLRTRRPGGARRASCARDERVVLLRRGRRGRRRRLPGHAGPARASSGRSGCSTPRSRSWRSRARPSAARSAACGPVVEIMFGDFMALAMDSLVNQAAKCWFVSNEQAPVPLVIRCAVGGGGRFGAMHSQTPRDVVAEASPASRSSRRRSPDDARGLMQGRRARLQPRGRPSSTSGSTRSPASAGRWPCRRSARRAVVAPGPRRHHRLGHARRARRARRRGDACRVRDRRRGDRPAHACARSTTPRWSTRCGETSRLLAVEEGRRTGRWASGLARRRWPSSRSATSTTCGR